MTLSKTCSEWLGSEDAGLHEWDSHASMIPGEGVCEDAQREGCNLRKSADVIAILRVYIKGDATVLNHYF